MSPLLYIVTSLLYIITLITLYNHFWIT